MSASHEPGERHEFQPAFHDEQDRSSTLFDLRWVIGALFTLYGVILVIASFWISDAKAGGLNINLWLGAGMLTLGLLFLSWALLRPLQHLQAPSALAQAEQAAAGGEPGPSGDTGPDEAVPDDAVPDDAVPDDAVPDDTVPDDTVRGQHRWRRPRRR